MFENDHMSIFGATGSIKKSNKSIYGTTSEEDREELADEGIELLSIPWISKDN